MAGYKKQNGKFTACCLFSNPYFDSQAPTAEKVDIFPASSAFSTRKIRGTLTPKSSKHKKKGSLTYLKAFSGEGI